MANDSLKIGFIGLGALGQGLCSSLVRAGFSTTVTDLNQEAAQLRGDKVALQVELSEHQEAAEAEVLALPRRISGRGDVVDLWGVDGAPTVVELQALANPPVAESQRRQHA